MFGLLKSIGSKALSPFTSSKIKILTPFDPQLQSKLQQISNLILKSSPIQNQFKMYQQLNTKQGGTNFNSCLREIYQNPKLNTESLIVIIKFYTFLLTNCKNQLVICKLVSEPLVMELTKIVLEMEDKAKNILIEKQFQNNQRLVRENKQLIGSLGQQDEQNNKITKQIQTQQSVSIHYQKKTSMDQNICEVQIQHIPTQQQKPQQQNRPLQSLQQLQYQNNLDWQQINSYKVALIRSYINCINAETIKYMIINNELPIFINCLIGYKHYLNDGVEGTCISNCILMILTKINHNDEVCEIVFGEREVKRFEDVEKSMIAKALLEETDKKENKQNNQEKQVKQCQMLQEDDGTFIGAFTSTQNTIKQNLPTEKSSIQQLCPLQMKRSISNQKSIKLHDFIRQIITKISLQIQKLLAQITSHQQKIRQNYSSSQKSINQTFQRQKHLSTLLVKSSSIPKAQISIQFIQSNILFCIDLINSINNYNYIKKIKQNIGQVIQRLLIDRIVGFYCEDRNQHKGKRKFNLIYVRLLRFVMNLALICQEEKKIVKFLNDNAVDMLDGMLEMANHIFFKESEQNQVVLPFDKEGQLDVVDEQSKQKSTIQASSNTNPPSTLLNAKVMQHIKPFLTYICQYSLIILKQTISPHSRLASRKRLQISPQIIELKQSILGKLFQLLQQIIHHQQLSQGLCYKSVRNLLLCLFYLTIKEDKCSLSEMERTPTKSIQINCESGKLSLKSQSNSNKKLNLGLALQFKYNILLVHKKFCQIFKKTFVDNKNWPYIVNNYESLMRSIPDTILSPQQNDKYCQYHNQNTYYEQDAIRNKILICQAVRNYRYMIIHETKLQPRLIRLQNIYHRNFLSPGWNYHPGDLIKFGSLEQYKVICVGLLHSNSMTKLPIQIIQDFECLIISHKISEHNYKIVANIRYKKIHSFIPQNKNVIRMKLIGIQELVLEFGKTKQITTFKEYLNENRNKTRQKQLKFINFYLNMYLKDSQKLIEQIWEQDIVDMSQKTQGQIVQIQKKQQTNTAIEQSQQDISTLNLSPLKCKDIKHNQHLTPSSQQPSIKKLSYDNIQCQTFQSINNDTIAYQ